MSWYAIRKLFIAKTGKAGIQATKKITVAGAVVLSVVLALLITVSAGLFIDRRIIRADKYILHHYNLLVDFFAVIVSIALIPSVFAIIFVMSYELLLALIFKILAFFHRPLNRLYHKLDKDDAIAGKGIKAEREMWKVLKYFKKQLQKYDNSIKIERNIVMKNSKTGSKFDLDFIMYSKSRRILVAFECKGYSECVVDQLGNVTRMFKGKPIQDDDYYANPAMQLLGTIKDFLRYRPEFRGYLIIPVVAFPLCSYCENYDTTTGVKYYLRGDEEKFLSILRHLLIKYTQMIQ